MRKQWSLWLSYVLSILTGLVFLLSAISKLPALEPFGWTIVETTFLDWTSAEWTARIFVGLEFYLGLLFISRVQLRKIAIPLATVLLLLFTVYLVLVWFRYGNTMNCGCFGDWIPMTPMQSMIKNLVLGGMIFLLSRHRSEWYFPYSTWAASIGLLVCLVFPVLWLLPESLYIHEKEPALNKPIPLSLLYTSKINTAPAVELRRGKHILAFMSLTCPFCRKAARRLGIMKRHYPELPIYLVLNGDKGRLDDFFSETQAFELPYTLFNGAPEFMEMNGGQSLPTIKWVKDTTVVRESNYMTIGEEEIKLWLKRAD